MKHSNDGDNLSQQWEGFLLQKKNNEISNMCQYIIISGFFFFGQIYIRFQTIIEPQEQMGIC